MSKNGTKTHTQKRKTAKTNRESEKHIRFAVIFTVIMLLIILEQF